MVNKRSIMTRNLFLFSVNVTFRGKVFATLQVNVSDMSCRVYLNHFYELSEPLLKHYSNDNL